MEPSYGPEALFETLHRRSPNLDALMAAGQLLGIDWPADYLAFMRITDGAYGWIGESYVDFWSATELIERNRGYGVQEFAPTLVIFGSDGGGEAFAFDLSTSPPGVVMVPFVGLEAPIPQGASFGDFIMRLGAGQGTE